MRYVKQASLVVLVMLLLTACEALPTEELTASMGMDQLETIRRGASNEVVEAAVVHCSGTLDAERNLRRVSFELETQEDVFETGGEEEMFLFGGGMMLLGDASVEPSGNFQLGLGGAMLVGEASAEPSGAFQLDSGGAMLIGDASAEPSGNYHLRCEGPATITAAPLRFDKVMKPLSDGPGPILWPGVINVPQLTVASPSGATMTLTQVSMHGLLGAGAPDISNEIAAAYDLNPNDRPYQSFFSAQKAFYEHEPDVARVREMAQNNGLSARNAARLGDLYVEQDVNRQRTLLVDMITSPEDEAYAEAVVGATIKTLAAAGLDFQTISNLFAEETEGRVTLQFVGDDAPRAAIVDTQIAERDDGADSVVFTVSLQEPSSSDDNHGTTGAIIDASTGEILWSVLNGATEGAAFVAAADARFTSSSAVGALIGAVTEFWWDRGAS